MTDTSTMTEERQLALLVSQAVDYAIFTLDPSGAIRTWNPGAERLKGYTRDEIVGKHFSVFYSEEDRRRDHPAEELRIAAREGRYEEEGWRLRKDGSRFWANVVITALRDTDGELVGFGKVSRDLTVRRLAEEQTRAHARALQVANSELEEFRRLVSSVRDYAIFMLDTAGYILSWNTGAQHLKGYEPQEIIGRHFSTFYTAKDRARDHPANELAIAIQEGRYEEEGWRVRKDGTMFWASVTITAVRDDAGRLTGFAKVTRDLTERKRSEDALRQAVEDLRAANAELDRFASVAAHDMTDPLRTISGFAEVLVELELSAEQRREYSQHILDSSLRLTAMLQGLLAYARAGARVDGPGEVPLSEVLEQVRSDLAIDFRDRHAELIVELPAGAAAHVDASDLRAVFQNLVSNAIKFGDPATPVVTVGAVRAGHLWQVTVSDNGSGIPAEDQVRIFGAFERGPASAGAGYGLGLATCKRLVERAGGQIGISSGPGEGARIWFTLPAAFGATAPERRPERQTPAALGE